MTGMGSWPGGVVDLHELLHGGATRPIAHGTQGCTYASRTTYAHRQADTWASCRVQGPDTAIASSSTHQLFIHSFMFFPVQFRSSDCVERMYVDPINGLVQLAYRKGAVYEYSHVSRKAIINLLMNPNMSLGLWVNDNLLSYNSKSAIYGDCITLRCLDSKNLPIAAWGTAWCRGSNPHSCLGRSPFIVSLS